MCGHPKEDSLRGKVSVLIKQNMVHEQSVQVCPFEDSKVKGVFKRSERYRIIMRAGGEWGRG